MSVLEDLLDRLPGPFDNLPGPFHSPNRHMSAGLAGTLADIRGRIYRMQRNQVDRAFARAFGDVTCALTHTFANISRPTPDFSARASQVFVMLRVLLRNGLSWRARLLSGWTSRLSRCSRSTLPVATHGRDDNHGRQHSRFAFHSTAPFIRLDDRSHENISPKIQCIAIRYRSLSKIACHKGLPDSSWRLSCAWVS
jgi:hypothetical protein